MVRCQAPQVSHKATARSSGMPSRPPRPNTPLKTRQQAHRRLIHSPTPDQVVKQRASTTSKTQSNQSGKIRRLASLVKRKSLQYRDSILHYQSCEPRLRSSSPASRQSRNRQVVRRPCSNEPRPPSSVADYSINLPKTVSAAGNIPTTAENLFSWPNRPEVTLPGQQSLPQSNDGPLPGTVDFSMSLTAQLPRRKLKPVPNGLRTGKPTRPVPNVMVTSPTPPASLTPKSSQESLKRKREAPFAPERYYLRYMDDEQKAEADANRISKREKIAARLRSHSVVTPDTVQLAPPAYQMRPRSPPVQTTHSSLRRRPSALQAGMVSNSFQPAVMPNACGPVSELFIPRPVQIPRTALCLQGKAFESEVARQSFADTQINDGPPTTRGESPLPPCEQYIYGKSCSPDQQCNIFEGIGPRPLSMLPLSDEFEASRIGSELVRPKAPVFEHRFRPLRDCCRHSASSPFRVSIATLEIQSKDVQLMEDIVRLTSISSADHELKSKASVDKFGKRLSGYLEEILVEYESSDDGL